MNRALSSLHGGSLEITLHIAFLSYKDEFLLLKDDVES